MTTAATTKLFSGLHRIGQSESVRWWLLVAITVTLPFTMLFNSFLIILLGAHWLLEGRFPKSCNGSGSNRWRWPGWPSTCCTCWHALHHRPGQR
jgi:hypothetical protein